MTAAPPAWRLLWRLGFEVPPPMFASFSSIALVSGLFFGTFWGLLMWLMEWSDHGFSLRAAVIAASFTGTLFGLAMATYFHHVRRKHGLSPWSTYTGQS
jgi:uncharacterized membrane protein (UPF0136 family)